MEPQDSIAFIGHNPGDDRNNNIYIATGDSGNGITHGTVAGILLTDLILGKNNPWTALYNPSRKPRKSSDAKPEKEGQTTQTNEGEGSTNGNGEKSESSKDKTKKTVYIENLQEGQGIVLEDKKMAAYKDHKGELRTYSAICTHLGCTVTWNNSEKSFDCPCHGSRFSAASGNVINGPANFELKPPK
jgi:Rieske Fe-S protein